MAYKVFSNGDALTGSELNTYLMNQSVMVFATATARDAALTTPTEGMLVWLEDSDKYVKYVSGAWTDLISAAGSGNAIINGAFEINQRNFSSSTSSGIGFDRWTSTIGGDGTTTVSSQVLSPGTLNLGGFGDATNNIRLVTSGQTSAAVRSSINQAIEDVRTFAGQTVTLSFYAKAASGTPKIFTEIAQLFGSGGSSAVITSGGQVTLSTSWARYSITIAVPSIVGKTIGSGSYMTPTFWVSAGTDFSSRTSALGIQSNTFDICGVQLEAGSVATPFKRNAPSIQAELAACQRYYWRGFSSATNPYQIFASGSATSTTNIFAALPVPTTMRTSPTSIEFGNLAATADQSSTLTITNVTLANGTNASQPFAVFTVSGATQFRPYQIQQNNNTAGFVGVSAEL